MSSPALKQALSKIRLRILPFVALMFAMAIIDRSNIGFAKHAFQADTGLSNAAFALGAGIFLSAMPCLKSCVFCWAWPKPDYHRVWSST